MPVESPQTEMSVAELVKALGGPSAVARLLGLRPEAVCMWYGRARPTVPPKHRAALWRLAQQRGVPWTPPGFEGLRLEPVSSHARDDNHGEMFPQCSTSREAA